MIRRARVFLFALTSVAILAIGASAQNYRYVANGIVWSGNGTAAPTICFESSFNSGPDVCLSRSSAGVASVTDAFGNAASLTASKLTSTVATGTAPLVVTSTTPVANLTAVPTTYSSAGTQQTGVHISTGTVTLSAGAGTLTLTGLAVFTSSSTYACSATDTTSAAAVKVVYTSGTTVTLAGTSTDIISVVCVGN